MFRSNLLHYGKAAVAVLALVPLAGCRQDMQDQPKFFPQRGTTLFADGRSSRPQVTNTVARSQAISPGYFSTGLVEGGAEGDGMPYKVTTAVLERGQERYNVYCTPCHSRVGNGKGMIVERGYYAATSFHSYRLRSAPLGHFFSVITNGYGAMPDYAAQVAPADRWAIAAYIRALQLSQNATQADVPAGAHIETIAAVEDGSGYSEEFLGDWLGSTAVHAHPTTESAAPQPMKQTSSVTTPASTVPPLAATSPNANKAPATKTTVVASAAGAPKAQAAAAPPAAQEAPAKPKAAAGDAAAGKTVYANNCSVCHQPTRAGMPPVFPSLIGVVDRVGEKRVRTVAREGIPEAKPPMPAHPNLTDKDLDDLLAFLKTKP